MTSPIERFIVGRPLVSDGLALLAGCLFPLSFSPFGLWPLSLITIGLLALVVSPHPVSIRRGSLRFYLFALGMYGVGVSWIYNSIHDYGNASPLLAGFLVALFVAGFSLLSLLHGYLFMRFVRPLAFGMLLGFPLAWLLREWAFTWVLTGFPWLLVGYGWLDTPMSGYVPVIGVLGTGLLVVLQASLIVWLLRHWRRFAVVAGGVLLIWSLGFALTTVHFVSPREGPLSVAAVQGNIDQAVKWRRDMIGPIIDIYLGLTNEVWDSDLIIWPEASITLLRADAEPLLDVLERRAGKEEAALILGLPDRGPGGEFWNTAIAIGAGEGQYIKRRLVPFGEYVPLEGVLRGLIDFFDLPMSRNRPGDWHQEQLRALGLRVGVSICYEVVYPELVRSPALEPDLLVTISNDTWFGDSIGPWQHLQMARARALENGRYLVRATNNGITAIVDPRGEITARIPQFEPGVLRGEVSRMSGHTPFARVGSLPLVVAAALALLALGAHRIHVSRTSIG